MAKVSFRLKEPGSSSESLIYLFFSYRGEVLKYSTSENINPLNWSFKLQRAKKNTATTKNKKYALNDFLDTLSDKCESIYNESLKNGVPSKEFIKQKLTDYVNRQNQTDDETGQKSSLHELIDRFTTGEIFTVDGRKKAYSTLQTYKSTQNHLIEFEKKYRYPLNFDTITLDFFDKFNNYLIKQGIGNNSRSKYVKTLKVFMTEAVERELTTNLAFQRKKFNVKRTETEAIYLNNDEIQKLYKYDLSDRKGLEKVRDLFVLGCHVGLRFSDFSRIKPENIVTIEGEKFIKIQTQKTHERVIIPFNPIITEIFKKYKGKIPTPISNQKFNDYIKDIAELAELNETGKLYKSPDKQLYECISSHTARRSFATNLYLSGFPTLDIMKITGHKTEKSFMQYVKVSKEETAKRLSKHHKKTFKLNAPLTMKVSKAKAS